MKPHKKRIIEENLHVALFLRATDAFPCRSETQEGARCLPNSAVVGHAPEGRKSQLFQYLEMG